MKNSIYLAGSMEKRRDNGARWRNAITPFLKKLGYSVYDPCKKEESVLDKYNMTPRDLKNLPKHTKLYKQIAKDIRAYDIDLIKNKCDTLIVYIDKAVLESSGTVSEVSHADEWGKKIYAVIGVPMKDIPLWTIASLDEVFTSFKDLKAFLKSANKKKKVKVILRGVL